MLQWRYSGVTVLLQWCYSGVTVLLQWCYSGINVLFQWLCNGSESHERPRVEQHPQNRKSVRVPWWL
jgi:hypothetical protein